MTLFRTNFVDDKTPDLCALWRALAPFLSERLNAAARAGLPPTPPAGPDDLWSFLAVVNFDPTSVALVTFPPGHIPIELFKADDPPLALVEELAEFVARGFDRLPEPDPAGDVAKILQRPDGRVVLVVDPAGVTAQVIVACQHGAVPVLTMGQIAN